EIGYDPTVHRVLHKDKIQYVYEVVSEGETRYFRTKKTLFTSRVLSITGRKTRVWKAVEVEGYENEQYRKEKVRGKEVALKDCWLGEGSRTEKDNLSAIFERLEAVKEKVKDDPKILDWADPSGNRQLFEDLLDTGNYKGYFMEIECDTKLAITKARLPTAQPVPDFLVPLEREETSSGNAGPQSTQTTQSLLEMAHQRRNARQGRLKPSTPREYRAKQHYRLIYKEVGRPLHAATNLGSSLQGLADTLIALTLLYLAGYVHRDVSIGNIILVDSSDGIPRGKLSDLEYAKVFQEGEPSADPKTGTLFFMAYEIHAGNVLYNPLEDLDHDFNLQTEDGHAVSPTPSTMLTRPKFRFTHDLESLLWVTLYILAKYLPQDERSRKFVNEVYVPASNPSQRRLDIIRMKRKDFQHYLEGHLHSKIACFAVYLAHYKSVLGWSYMDERSVDNMLDHASYGLVYKFTHQAFSGIKKAFESGKAPDFEFTHNTGAQEEILPSESQRKRPRTQGEGEDDDYVPVEQGINEEQVYTDEGNDKSHLQNSDLIRNETSFLTQQPHHQLQQCQRVQVLNSLYAILEDFQGHYAPWQVPATIIDSVYALYVEGEEHSPPLVKQIKQGEGTTIQNPWVFTKLETEPTNAERQETDMFEKLKDTVNSLCESKVRGKLKEINRTATLRYENCPDKGMTPEIKKGTNLRADAYLTVRELDSQSEDFDHRDCSPEVDLAD
ncbi:hypothetical protein AGABI1DRAFT_95858, partial [Agaricus bisporus var. burnettii JB137-S8]